METEVKLELDGSTYREILRRCVPVGEATHQTNCFYDSAGRDLKRAGWALRVRTQADRYFLTVKGRANRNDDGLYTRFEREDEIDPRDAVQMRVRFRLTDFDYRPLKELLAQTGDLDMAVIYEFGNWRTRLGFGRWELELDRTEIGDTIHFELELETSEDAAGEATRDLKDWFREQDWAFKPSAKSKMAKAEELFLQRGYSRPGKGKV